VVFQLSDLALQRGEPPLGLLAAPSHHSVEVVNQ